MISADMEFKCHMLEGRECQIGTPDTTITNDEQEQTNPQD